MTAAFEEIVDDFAFLDDWEDRYRHVIELGKAMPEMDAALKSGLTKVDGCVSQVWIAPKVVGEGAGARLHFSGDSDAMIVRGLIAILHARLDGLAVEEIIRTDLAADMARIGLDQHLSPQRSNGLKAMIGRLHGLAQAAMAEA